MLHYTFVVHMGGSLHDLRMPVQYGDCAARSNLHYSEIWLLNVMITLHVVHPRSSHFVRDYVLSKAGGLGAAIIAQLNLVLFSSKTAQFMFSSQDLQPRRPDVVGSLCLLHS